MKKIYDWCLSVMHNTSIRMRLFGVYALTVVVILISNIVIFVNINSQMSSMDDVYATNEQNSELHELLESVQSSMTDYMLTKSTDIMEGYYRSVYELQSYLDNMDTDIKGNTHPAMRDDIRSIAQTYLGLTEETIQSKRGRDVEKYRECYDAASELYQYINDYIFSYNTIQFVENSNNYDRLRNSMSTLEVLSFVVLGIISVAGIGLTLLMTDKVTRPLAELAEQAELVSQGNFEVEFKESQWHDETEVLSRAFARMIVSIRLFMDQEKKSMAMQRDMREKELKMEAEIKEAQLKYFQAQINPHFLFNTLNAGVQLAMLEDAPRTGTYIGDVAEFFRYNIRKDDGATTLGDEVRSADYYMRILKVRFGDSISFVKDVEETLAGTKMPKMVLQPLMENCVNHGIRNIPRDGVIYLTVYKQNDEILISVADNGIGMTEDRIKEILSGDYKADEKMSDSNGVGLGSVIRRLELFYGKEDIVEIISEGVDQGTEFLIHVPCKENLYEFGDEMTVG